ncbi:RNA methyltransferase [Leptospira sp. 96542]|nr:RNA methyltransferase [Leptospira sp. 96542]
MVFILSPDDERLSEYSLLKSKEENSEYFIADHEKTAVRLLESNLEIISVFCLPKYYEKHKSLIFSKIKDPNFHYVANKDVFEKTIGFRVHQGFMAVGRKRFQMENLLKPPILFLNGIVDSENIGSIFRTALAFGVQSFVIDSFSASPYLRRSVRVSMGTVFKSNILKIEDAEVYLKNLDLPIYALSLPVGRNDLLLKTKSIYKFKSANNFLLIVGNENNGVHTNLLDLADQIIYIPMKNEVDSLNVSHALAVALSNFCD